MSVFVVVVVALTRQRWVITTCTVCIKLFTALMHSLNEHLWNMDDLKYSSSLKSLEHGGDLLSSQGD